MVYSQVLLIRRLPLETHHRSGGAAGARGAGPSKPDGGAARSGFDSLEALVRFKDRNLPIVNLKVSLKDYECGLECQCG